MPKIAPPPQEKSGFATPQQTPEIKMPKMKKDGAEKAKNDLRRLIKSIGLDPQRLIRAGQLAEMALKDKNLYPMAVQNAIQEGLISPQDIKQGGVDYKLLAQGITVGKLTQQLIQEGKL